MLRIGLTGGIGSGKSTVAALFAALGIPVIDADEIARELVEPGQPSLAQIVQVFGNHLLIDGQLNRAALRELVFQSPESRSKLEGILHPLVFHAMEERARALNGSYCIFAIPLLIETASRHFVDRVLVIDCPEQVQVDRVRRRDNLAPDIIAKIMANQASRAERLATADDVVSNDGGLAELKDSIGALHRRYIEIAQTSRLRRAID